MKRFMRMVSVVLLMAMALQVVAYGAEKIPESRSIRLYEIEGTQDGVTITRGAKKELQGIEGMALTANDKVTTGSSTIVYLEIDDNKVVKLDKNSSISISKASSKSLQITLISGEVYFNTNGSLQTDEDLSFTAGGTTMGVRGTSGTYSNKAGVVTTSILNGNVEIFTDSGQRISVTGGSYSVTGTDGVVVTESAPLNVEQMSSFALETVIEILTAEPTDEAAAEAQTALKATLGIADGDAGATQIQALETLATQAAAQEAETEAEQQEILEQLKTELEAQGTTAEALVGTLDSSITNAGQTPAGGGSSGSSSGGSDIKYYTATDATDWETFSSWFAQDGGVNVNIPAGVTLDFSTSGTREFYIYSGKSLSIAGTFEVARILVRGGGLNNSGTILTDDSYVSAGPGVFNNSGTITGNLSGDKNIFLSPSATFSNSADLSTENAVTAYGDAKIQNTGKLDNIQFDNSGTLNIDSTGTINTIEGNGDYTLIIENWNALSEQKLYSEFDGSTLTPAGGLTEGFAGTYMWAASAGAAGAWVKAPEGGAIYHHTQGKTNSELTAAISNTWFKIISLEGGDVDSTIVFEREGTIIIEDGVDIGYNLAIGGPVIVINKGAMQGIIPSIMPAPSGATFTITNNGNITDTANLDTPPTTGEETVYNWKPTGLDTGIWERQ